MVGCSKVRSNLCIPQITVSPFVGSTATKTVSTETTQAENNSATKQTIQLQEASAVHFPVYTALSSVGRADIAIVTRHSRRSGNIAKRQRFSWSQWH